MNARQVTLDVSSACNFRCTYCAVAGSCARESEPVDVPAALSRLRAEGYGVVVFSGGEPTLHKDLGAWIAHARAVGFEQRTIVTNGSLLGDRGLVHRLVDAGLTHVNVSFHTCRPELFDELAGVAGAFARVRAGLATLVAVNEQLGHPLFIHTNLLLMRATADHVAATIGQVASLGIRRVTLEVVRARGGVVGREDDFRCLPAELPSILERATACAARLGVTLNTIDIPACFGPLGGDIDISSFVVRREKAVHWVVSRGSEGRLNRDTHFKGPRCAECAFDRWCTGIERTLLAPDPEASARLEDGSPLPAPVAAAAVLDATRARVAAELADDALGTAPVRLDARTVAQGVGTARARVDAPTADGALDVCSLLSPPDARATASWLRLYHAYGRTLLPFARTNRQAAAAALGLFPPATAIAAQEPSQLAASLRSMARREAVLEERLARLSARFDALPCEPPACCLRAGAAELPMGALLWPQSLVRGTGSPWLCSVLLPSLLPYLWCSESCEPSAALARSRLGALDDSSRRAALALLSAPTLALGPWIRVVTGGTAGPTGTIDYDPRGLIVLTDPQLARAEREALRRAAAELVVPLLQAGDSLVEQPLAVVVCKGGREVAALPRKLRWAGVLCCHGAASAADCGALGRDECSSD